MPSTNTFTNFNMFILNHHEPLTSLPGQFRSAESFWNSVEKLESRDSRLPVLDLVHWRENVLEIKVL